MPFSLRSQKTRNALLQVLFVGVIAFIVIGGFVEARQNMRELNLVSGFDFLWRSTGWDVNFSLLPTSSSDPYWWFFLNGLINTIFLGAIGLAAATLIGSLVGGARISSNELLQLLGRTYVDFFRNIPLILQLFFWYAVYTNLPSPRNALQYWPFTLSNRGIYMPGFNVDDWHLAVAFLLVVAAVVASIWLTVTRRISSPPEKRRPVKLAVFSGGLILAAIVLLAGREAGEPLFAWPELQGLNVRGGLRISPEFSALITAMALYGGAYIGEIVRGGFNAVGRGQVEASQSLGLTPWQTFSRIRLPLALRAMLPILANQYIWLVKATTLGIAVGLTDFFMVVAITINQSGQTLEAIGILMAGFLLINLTLAAIFNRFNKAIALKGDQLRS